jgi:uncharacterized protein YjbI with pentapeptide repeats
MAKVKKAAAAEQTVADYFPASGPEADRSGVKKWNRLTSAQRSKVNFKGIDLSGRDLTGINLNDVVAEGASFAGTTLASARLAGNFKGASFAGATLAAAKLVGGSFDEADFSSANLRAANLCGAHFRRATFNGADLAEANLKDVSLFGVDLTGANLASANFSGGWFDKDTKWAAGFVPPGDMAWHGSGTDPRLSGKGKKAVATDINGLLARLHAIIDPARMKRTLDMLKAERHQLFSEIEPTMVRGIVRSQKQEDRYYLCVLTEDGTYSCATPEVAKCMGLSNEPCKHILVLVIGLARAGLLDSTTADRWLLAAKEKNPRWNKTVQNYVSDSLLRYKGVQAGDVDWRPTETIPEDFYAM